MTDTLTTAAQCMTPGCYAPRTRVVTMMIGFRADLGSVPGNGRLLHWRFCEPCAAELQRELHDDRNARFVCSIPIRHDSQGGELS